MAKNKGNEIAVGITVLIVLALSFWVVLMLSDLSVFFESRQSITVKLPYKVGLRGLISGSPVYLGGAKIGQVTQTGIDIEDQPTDSFQDIYVYFTLKIPEKYPLRNDCVLVPESNVLGGQTVLNIESLGINGRIIKDGETVSVTFKEGFAEAIMRQFDPENPTSLVALLKSELDRDNNESLMASLVTAAAHFREIARKLDEEMTRDEDKATLMAKLHTLIDQLGQAAGQLNHQLDTDDKEAVMTKLHLAMDTLNDSMDHFQELIDTSKPDIEQMAKSLRNVAETLEEDVPQITTDVKTILTKVNTSVDAARDGLQQFKNLATEANERIVLNSARIDQLVSNITEVSVNLKLASREIRRAPWKLLYKPGKDEAQVQALIDSARDFSEGAEALYNMTLTLKAIARDAGETIAIDKEELNKIINELEAQFEKYPEIQQKLLDKIELD